MNSSKPTVNIKLKPWQQYAAFSGNQHMAMIGGVGSGKTYTGSQYSILKFLAHPEKTGLIGANDYNQLSQATLRELFYWLDEYQLEYVVDCRPPKTWGAKKMLKTYKNVLSVKIGKHTAHAFIRVLSNPDSMRGIEISWYWIDESRDTKQYAHDMILGRLRESELAEGLVTTTANGEDWVHSRFVRARAGQRLYGSMHVKTIDAVRAGVLTQSYYDTLRATYSPLMAAQELEAEHVNVHGGRAYYAAGAWNRLVRAPWGDKYPSAQRPIIVGCDFNFQPAPCVWVVGQVGPDMYGPNGEYWGNSIHWFREIASVQTSTETMTMMLATQFPGFFYRIYGDSSGKRGTTSNAGETDYNKIANVLSDEGAMFTIDVEQSNPLVKNRVENMNALYKNAMGLVRQTYDPSGCPLMDADVRMTGWKKQLTITGQGKLDTGGDPQRTHATDGAGYACWKLFPPGRKGRIIETNKSGIRQSIIDEVQGNRVDNTH